MDRQELLTATPQGLLEAWATLVSPADAEVLNEGLAEHLVESLGDGLAPGTGGWIDDSYAHVRDWGFDLATITIPVQVWHGRQDRFVPFQHGEWLAAHVPGADSRLTDEDGHLTLYQRRVPEIHAWLVDRL